MIPAPADKDVFGTNMWGLPPHGRDVSDRFMERKAVSWKEKQRVRADAKQKLNRILFSAISEAQWAGGKNANAVLVPLGRPNLERAVYIAGEVAAARKCHASRAPSISVSPPIGRHSWRAGWRAACDAEKASPRGQSQPVLVCACHHLSLSFAVIALRARLCSRVHCTKVLPMAVGKPHPARSL